MKRFVFLALACLAVATSAFAQSYPAPLYTWTTPAGACTPPSDISGCITKDHFVTLAEEMEALQAAIGVNFTGIDDHVFDDPSAAGMLSLGTGINTSTPAEAPLKWPIFSGAPPTVNGHMWLQSDGSLRFTVGGVTKVLTEITGGYQIIQEDGVAQTQRTTVNFTGTGITCGDSGGITVCNVPGVGTIAFSDLADVDTDYTGDATKLLSVNMAENGIEFRVLSSGDIPSLDAAKITTGTFATARVVSGTITNERCLRVDGSGNVVVASADCGAGGGGSAISFDATNDAVNESSGITHLECDGNGLACSEPVADEARIALSIGTGATQVAAGDHAHAASAVTFSDPDSNWTAADVDAALAELDDVINGGVPNSATAKVDWSQLANVPAGFADGTDDGAGGGSPGGDTHDVQYNTGAGFGGENAFEWDAPNNRLKIAGATTATDNSAQMLLLTGTLPSSPSATVHGARFDVTSAGSAAQEQVAAFIQLLAGYTGSSPTTALTVSNPARSTGNTLNLASTTPPVANRGVISHATGVGAGANIASVGRAGNSTDPNIGVMGGAVSTAAGEHIGVLGMAGQSTEATGLKNVAGLLTLNTSLPTGNIDAALIADNGAVSGAYIARFLDNGSSKLDILDDGAIHAAGIADPGSAGSGNGRLWFDSTAGKWKAREGTGSATDLIGGGSSSGSWSTKTGDYTLTSSDDAIGCNGGVGVTLTMTLPAAASNSGKVFRFKKLNAPPADRCIIDGNASETIDGQTTQSLRYKFEEISIQSDGSNWHIIDEVRPRVFSMQIKQGALHTSGTRYAHLNQHTSTLATILEDVDQYIGYAIEPVYMVCGTQNGNFDNGGGSEGYTISIENFTVASGWSCQILDTATSCIDTAGSAAQITTAAGFYWRIDAVGTPASGSNRRFGCSLFAYMR